MQNIFSNSNCIGCNKCISACPAVECVTRLCVDGKSQISVDAESCVRCGRCIDVCNSNALDYTDDTARFLQDLKSGAEIVLAIDPAFYVHFDDANKILSYLKKLGAKAIYNVAFGNDIALWATCHYLLEHQNEFLMISQCTSATEYLNHCKPDLFEKLVPVALGYECLATYLRKYHAEKRRIAYISPCFAVPSGEKLNGGGTINYNVTLKNLFAQIESDLQKYDETELHGTVPEVAVDLDGVSTGTLFSVNGALKRAIEYFVNPEASVFDIHDALNFFTTVNGNMTASTQKHGILILSNCVFGCALGTGVNKKNSDMAKIFAAYENLREYTFAKGNFHHEMKVRRSVPERMVWLDSFFAGVDRNDFYIKPEQKYREPYQIPVEVYAEIFEAMHKHTIKSRHVDCGSCGYDSCKKMVKAIAKGQNQIENCVEYVRYKNDKALSTDFETGLQNMQMFKKHLTTRITEKSLAGFSVLRVHIKNLGLINEIFGFENGNKVLFEFSKAAKANLLDDEKIFHNSGPSFFAIIKNERVNKFIFGANHFEISSKNDAIEMPQISCKCGIYALTGAEKSFEEIITYVSSAYARTKDAGSRDVVYYNAALNDTMIRSLMIAQQLPKALRKNELTLVLQPKVSIDKHTLVGAEALVRWNHDGENISPQEFIQISETSGFIKRLDFFMLTEVCKNISVWKDIGVQMDKIRISINFSKRHFAESGIAERICAVIDTYNIPHECIEIEITESSFLDDLNHIRQGLDDLRASGIFVSIDDFGTGYSSISLLQSLKFDVIKFDKTFTDTVTHGSRAEIVMRDIVHMAKDLKMEVVAEGVETWEKLELLKTLGCDVIQGYVFDKPLSPQEFLKRLVHKNYE